MGNGESGGGNCTHRLHEYEITVKTNKKKRTKRKERVEPPTQEKWTESIFFCDEPFFYTIFFSFFFGADYGTHICISRICTYMGDVGDFRIKYLPLESAMVHSCGSTVYRRPSYRMSALEMRLILEPNSGNPPLILNYFDASLRTHAENTNYY